MKIEDFFKGNLLDDMDILNNEIQAVQENIGNITYEQSLELVKTLLISKHMENLEKLTNQTNEYLRDISDALDDLAEDLDVD